MGTGEMMTKLFCAPVLLVGAVVLSAAAPAAVDAPAPKLLGAYQDWTAYTIDEPRGGVICYAISKPKKLAPATLKRGDATLLVTHRPVEKQINVVSVELGFAPARDSSAAIQVGKDKFDFFTEKQTAWARDSETDKAVVTAMAHGADFTAKAKPAAGGDSVDNYSLAGFPDALAQIDKACKIRR
jgi:Invasion associated locus B (IalB) protein